MPLTPTPTVVVHQFKTVYKPGKPDPQTGKSDAAEMKAVDWVIYGPIGSGERTPARIGDLSRVIASDDMTNPAIAMANARWSFIKPLYEAWKEGHEMPLTGTPLAAWNLLTPEQGEVFRARGIKTVEAIAAMSAGHAEKIPLPHMADIIKQAQHFLDSADQVRAAAELADKDRKIAALQVDNTESREQIAALSKQVEALAGMVTEQRSEPDDAPVKRKPGRPKKQPEQIAA